MSTVAIPPDELERRKQLLVFRLESTIPEMLRAIEETAKTGAKIAIMQEAFAPNFDDREYALLGMWIKYAELRQVDITIFCKKERNKNQSN